MTTRKQLQYKLAMEGISIAQIALETCVSSVTVYEVLRGRTTSRRIQAALEAVFDMPIEEIRRAWANDPKPQNPALRQILSAAGVSRPGDEALLRRLEAMPHRRREEK